MSNLLSINGYRIYEDFTSENSGLSRWCFAEKDKKIYFLKEFLFPTYPANNEYPRSIFDLKISECQKFEEHNNSINAAIKSNKETKNLILTLDFFRYKAKYYKVTKKIDTLEIDVKKNLHKPTKQLIPNLIEATQGLNSLHAVNIVHGDLRPSNILFSEGGGGKLSIKIIDYDSGYFSGYPPRPSIIVGDPLFYSPELALYIIKANSVEPEFLQTNSDIFSLGLLFHWFLTGRLPNYDMKYDYPSVALLNGSKLGLSLNHLPSSLRKMIESMLEFDPDKRPTTSKILRYLKHASSM